MARKKLPDKDLAAARASGYKRGVHQDKDRQTGVKTYSRKALINQDLMLNKYVT
jgi:hypothetical protein